MSIKHVELFTRRTGVIRDKKLQCIGSLLERRRSSKVLDANRDNKNEMEAIMRAAMDLDDHDH